jgi:formate dehydrogenase major subunit
MTNHWVDFRNADAILAIGGNNAENHPISMKWVEEARSKGGTYIVVDPRFTRSAALADIYAPLRPGTDAALLGGLINYVITNGLYNEEYVKAYTTAPLLVADGYSFSDGLFSGFDPATHVYDRSSWTYQVQAKVPWDTAPGAQYAWVEAPGVPKFTLPQADVVKSDQALKDPHCVFQLLKQHYSRYTPQKVSEITGTPVGTFLKVAEAFAATGKPGKSGALLYAMGITQHSNGTQNVRATAILQLLLGNIGVAGGGVNALRGESNVQGSTDMGLLSTSWTGYLNAPKASAAPTLSAYLTTETPGSGYMTNKPKFVVSLLKELYGDKATAANNYCYDNLPKLGQTSHTFMSLFEAMNAGTIKGLFLFGQNPAVGSPNSRMARQAMHRLDWMVAVDLFGTETAEFWRAPDNETPPSGIKTEVFLLPAACHYEKQGSIANSGRWIQWRWKAVEPLGDARDDGEIVSELVHRLKKLYATDGVAPAPITDLTWDYEDEDGHFDVTRVARAINGFTVTDGKPVKDFTVLQADGSTACGCWIFAGYFNNADSLDPASQPTGSRDNADAGVDGLSGGLGNYPKWSYAWPLNRRVLYNRASADPAGRPWDSTKALVQWDGARWLTNDVPDFAYKKTLHDGTVQQLPPDNKAFMMNIEQAARFFSPAILDGPLPEHYEPFESPSSNPLSSVQVDPVALVWGMAELGTPDKYPIVMTTYRVTEHWQTGGMTRNSPWLVEALPMMFVEMSEELAAEKGITTGDMVAMYNQRGRATAHALVTPRIRPFTVDGKTVHMVGLPWHWGFAGHTSQGDSANYLTPNVGDVNSQIPEFKAFLVQVEKVS